MDIFRRGNYQHIRVSDERTQLHDFRRQETPLAIEIRIEVRKRSEPLIVSENNVGSQTLVSAQNCSIGRASPKASTEGEHSHKYLCRTSKMSHAGAWRDSWLCTRRDKPRRWLWRLVGPVFQ